ncbi:MAG: FkbM family methyltransferase [Bacteroidota bacterium]
MKKLIQSLLQRLLGFDRYLLWFSWFKIKTLHLDGPDKEGDFIYFLGMLSREAHVLDIGANIGIMTVLMAKRSPQGKVYAYEPVPENFKALEAICRFMKVDNVELNQLALGPENGSVKMQMPLMQGVRMQGLSHIVHDTIEGYDTKSEEYSVAQVVLDEVLADRPKPIAAIKMDVENYEQYVLKGALKLIAEDQPIIYMELWPNENRDNCLEMLEKLEYAPYVLNAKELQSFDSQIHEQHNFFFLPKAWN